MVKQVGEMKERGSLLPMQEGRQSSSQQRGRTLNWGEEIRCKGRPFPIPRLIRYGCRAARNNVGVRLTGARDNRGGKGDE